MITEAGLLHNLDYEISPRETCDKPLTPDQKIQALINNHQALENVCLWIRLFPCKLLLNSLLKIRLTSPIHQAPSLSYGIKLHLCGTDYKGLRFKYPLQVTGLLWHETLNSYFPSSYIPWSRAIPQTVTLSFQNLLLDKLNAIELLNFILREVFQTSNCSGALLRALFSLAASFP